MKTPRICIVTPDIVGPVNCGGVGTAYFSLANTLVKNGFPITIAFYDTLLEYDPKSFEKWIYYYRKLGIELIYLPDTVPSAEGSIALKGAFRAYQWLKTKSFDVVHFPDMKGLGYFSLAAKRQGLSFEKTHFCIGTHGSTTWHHNGGGEFIKNWNDFEATYLEQKSVEWADSIVSPSKYMLQWMQNKEWEIPAQALVIQNILPPGINKKENKRAEVREIVFYGRLEERKGLRIFCAALESIASKLSPDLKITFLGREEKIDGDFAQDFISKRLANCPQELTILDRFNHLDATNYLSHEGVLAVMPSLAENLPYAIMECLGSRTPFITTDLPGNRELVTQSDWDQNLFPATTKSIAEALLKKITSATPADFAVSPDITASKWIDFHQKINLDHTYQNPKEFTSKSELSITVCITHRNRPHLLEAALDSLKNQSVPNFDIVIVDDGSDTPGALDALKIVIANFEGPQKIQVLYKEHSGPGVCRNLAAEIAKSDWLLFMDDDNLAKPNEIEIFTRVALKTDADILTCAFDRFTNKNNVDQKLSTWVPMGGAIAQGMIENIYGDTNCFIKRSAFLDIGGFAEDKECYGEDWELLARAALTGFAIEAIPEALFEYREHPNSLSKQTQRGPNRFNYLRPYLQSSSMQSIGSAIQFLLSQRQVQNHRANVTTQLAPQKTVRDAYVNRQHWSNETKSITFESQDYRVRFHGEDGYIDRIVHKEEGTIEIAGWCFDNETQKSCEKIIVFVNHEHRLTKFLKVSEDVFENSDIPQRQKFKIRLPAAEVPAKSLVQVFGIFPRGIACELGRYWERSSQFLRADFEPFGILPHQFKIKGEEIIFKNDFGEEKKFYPSEETDTQLFQVDDLILDEFGFHLSGWAFDKEEKSSPGLIVVFDQEECIAIYSLGEPRYYLTDQLQAPEAETSGFYGRRHTPTKVKSLALYALWNNGSLLKIVPEVKNISENKMVDPTP